MRSGASDVQGRLREDTAANPTRREDTAANPTRRDGIAANPIWRRGLVIALLVGLAKADGVAVGVVAPVLQSDLHISAAQIGLLASLGAITGAVTALPAGSLVDHRRRVVVMTVALIAWSLVLGLVGLATGFFVLAAARLLSGGIASVARPVAVSVAGDRFEPAERGRALATLAVAGVVGTAACYILGAVTVQWLGWRWLFVLLGGAGLLLAIAASRMEDPVAIRPPAPSFRATFGSLLRIRTNLVVQIADSISTFFFAGVTSFAVLFVTRRYGMSTSVVDALVPVLAIGIVGGNLLGGRLGDQLAHRHGGRARIVVAIVCQLVAVVVFALALLNDSFVTAGLLLFLGSSVLGASGPCLDAVRLDVLPAEIRGRAEATRGLLTLVSGALGPLMFGVIATSLSGQGDGIALRDAYLWMLIPLALGAVTLLAAISPYRDDAVDQDDQSGPLATVAGPDVFPTGPAMPTSPPFVPAFAEQVALSAVAVSLEGAPCR